MKKTAISIGIVLLALIVLSMSTAMADSSALQITTSTTPSSVVPGNDLYIQLAMTNTGVSKIESVKIRNLKVDSPIITDSPIYLDSLGSLDYNKVLTQSMKFTVPANTSSGFYRAEFLIEACDSNTCKSYVQYSIISVQSPSGIEIKITPDTFEPGKVTNSAFIITNKASSIKNINFQWASNISSPLGTGNNFYIPEMSAGSEIVLPLNITTVPGAETGVTTITVTMTYSDQTGTTRTATFNIGVLVKSNIELLSSIDSQDVIIPGSKGAVSVKISNAGDDIKFLTVQASADSVDVSPKTIYVGNLKSDDYDTEKFTVNVGDGTSPGQYNMTLVMAYQDIFGEKHSTKSVLQFDVSSKDSVAKTDYTLTVAIVVAIVLIIGYLVYRRTRRK